MSMPATLMTDGCATMRRSMWRLEYSVSIHIQADYWRVWDVLTDAADFPRWNSAVESIDGVIRPNEIIKVRVPAAPGRVFRLRVSTFEPGRRMVWECGLAPMFRGVRTFALSPRRNGSITFAMEEAFSGLMLPIVARTLPDLTASFEQYAADLRIEVERTRELP